MNKNNKNPYPTLKVITLYPLLGGIISGAMALPILLYLFMTSTNDLNYIWLYFGYSFVVGLLPFLFVAGILVFFKWSMNTYRDYIAVFLMACLVIFAMALIVQAVWLVTANFSVKNNLNGIASISGVLALAGALSSVILAKFILPKY